MDAKKRSTPVASTTVEEQIGLGLEGATDALKAAHHILCRALYLVQTGNEEGLLVPNEIAIRTEEELEEVLNGLEATIETWPYLAGVWLQRPQRLTD
jgi:hypothetical protein